MQSSTSDAQNTINQLRTQMGVLQSQYESSQATIEQLNIHVLALEDELGEVASEFEEYRFNVPPIVDITLDPATTALMIVDMQKMYCLPNASKYLPEAVEAVQPISELVERARRKGIPMIYTFMALSAYPWEHEIVSEIRPREEDLVIEKTHDGMFLGILRLEANDLMTEFVEKNPEIRTFIVVGTNTNSCVLSMADTLYSLYYNLVIPVDCLGGWNYMRSESCDVGYDYALWFLGWLDGARLTTSEGISFS